MDVPGSIPGTPRFYQNNYKIASDDVLLRDWIAANAFFLYLLDFVQVRVYYLIQSPVLPE